MNEFWASGVSIWKDIRVKIGYQPKPTDSVVEIGCGVGRLSRAMSSVVGRIDAFDISQQMLDIAQQAGLPNVTFQMSKVDNLQPLRNSSADLVLAYRVFQQLPLLDVLRNYLGEMARVAKPGSICAFTLTPRTWRDNLRPLMKLKGRVRDLWVKWTKRVRCPTSGSVLGRPWNKCGRCQVRRRKLYRWEMNDCCSGLSDEILFLAITQRFLWRQLCVTRSRGYCSGNSRR
jgi:SAM-dependent methyltransferase